MRLLPRVLPALVPGPQRNRATSQSTPPICLLPSSRRSQLLDEVKAIAAANPRTMRYEVRSARDGNYSADVPVLTVAPAGLGAPRGDKVRLLVDFGEHGREFISTEVGLRFIKALGDIAALERAVRSPERAARVRRLLESCVFVVS